MTDTEAEKIGREWAAKRGKRPRNDGCNYLPFVWRNGGDQPSSLTDQLPSMIVAELNRLGDGLYQTESAAFAALGRAVVRGREVFA